jgi:pyruvate formate lyase activating enzyme
MKICGLNKTTLLDYPGYVAATVFVGGCNFRCPFCHNGDLVLCSNELSGYREEEIFAFLKKRKNVLEGVCVTGGEPTLYKELPKFIEKIKELGYKVKLDTNGSNPGMLKELVKEKLVDYIAMDIKAPVYNYDKVCGVLVDVEKIKESVEFLKANSVPYEFRTTLVKELHSKEDVLEIGKWILGAENYYLQSYQETDKNLSYGFLPIEKDEIKVFKEELKKYVKNVNIRGVE